MTSLQAGQRAPLLSAKVKMASATFIKGTAGCTHILCLILLGLLLPSVLVSGQDSTSATSMPSTNLTMSYGIMPYSSSMSMVYCPSFTCNYTDCYTMYSSQNATKCAAGACWCELMRQTDMCYTVGCSVSCADSCVNASQTNCSVDCCNSTGCLNSSFASMMMMTTTASTATSSTSITTSSGSMTSMMSTMNPSSNSSAAMTSSSTMNQSGSATTQSGAAMTQSGAAMTPSGTPMTSYSSSMSSMMSTWSPSSNSTGMNGTTMTYSTPMSMIYCPSFTCNYTDCYTMYTSQNDTKCAAGVYWCELMRQTDMCYTVGCSASCADSCVNASQTNCSVDCCNSTGCLNSSFVSMMMTTTTVTPTVTTSTPTTVPTTSPPTTANNGNKCHTGTCIGAECYTDFINKAPQTCTSSQIHCQLKKENKESGLQWTAGCTTNCSDKAACKVNTEPPCHLECCNATLTSCLWLNGTLNTPNMATRGPHLHTELIASLICLLAIAFLL